MSIKDISSVGLATVPDFRGVYCFYFTGRFCWMLNMVGRTRGMACVEGNGRIEKRKRDEYANLKNLFDSKALYISIKAILQSQ